jgi:hypothetical protein
MATKQKVRIEITPPNFQILPVRIEGTAPLMLHKFSEKMRKQIQEKQTSKDATRAKRAPKDYAAEFNAARYRFRNGIACDGITAGAFRAAMIAACRRVDGLPMTQAKGAFFIIADGRDETDGTPLIKIQGKPVHDTRPVRLESGVADMRNRPRYDSWACDLKIQFDADLLSANDVANLLARAGSTVGVGELRPQGPNSFGGDFGTFRVTSQRKVTK